jgi:hypothetical protein
MPVELNDEFESISMEEFEAMLAAGPIYGSAHPTMVKLMEALSETDQPIVIRLRDTQNARSVRSAISNVARHRGLRVRTAQGPGIVAVRRLGFISSEDEV